MCAPGQSRHGLMRADAPSALFLPLLSKNTQWEVDMYQRDQVATIAQRMVENGNSLMQVVVGPRQTGKSTMLFQALGQSKAASHFVSADDPLEPSAGWLRTEWQQHGARCCWGRHGPYR